MLSTKWVTKGARKNFGSGVGSGGNGGYHFLQVLLQRKQVSFSYVFKYNPKIVLICFINNLLHKYFCLYDNGGRYL